jgi:sugar lactone lactonase YvrE
MQQRSLNRRLGRSLTRGGLTVLASSLTMAGMGLAVGVARANPGDAPGTIRTIAGITRNYSVGGFNGDGGPATQAQLYDPRAIHWGNNGDLYFTDSLNERIRHIDAQGNITTVAGSPVDPNGNAIACTYPPNTSNGCGDGGPATAAGFYEPHGVAVDSAGNIYIADSRNARIRKIDTTGKITTFAGTGNPHDPHGDGGQATAASLKDPKQMMIVGNILYLCDTGHNMVRTIDLKTGIINTLVGTSQSRHYNTSDDGGPASRATLFQPKGMFITPDGTLYISDSDENLIRKVTPDGIIHTIAGDTAAAAANNTAPNAEPGDSAGDGGLAINAHVYGPRGIIVDSAGNIFFAETQGARIRRIDPSGIITTIAGDGQTRHGTNAAHGVVPGDPGPAPALQAEFDWPHDLLLDPSGNLIVTDQKDDRIRMITDAANAPGSTAPSGPGAGPGPSSRGVAPATPGQSGYWMLGADGKVYGFGDAHPMGDASANLPGGTKATHIEPTPDYQGYWIVNDAGNVYAYGDAKPFGNASGLAAGERVTSLSATPSGTGYWLFTTKGRVFPFGDAVSFGDLATTNLNGAIQSSIPTPTGKGYFMVGSDGGVFAFGDAVFHGSTGNMKLNQPVQSLVPTRDNKGYWLVASDGGIFAFGTAPFKGSMGATKLNKPVVGMVRYGDGYLMVGADGGIFDFSNKPFVGSLGANPPAHPIVFAATLDT